MESAVPFSSTRSSCYVILIIHIYGRSEKFWNICMILGIVYATEVSCNWSMWRSFSSAHSEYLDITGVY